MSEEAIATVSQRPSTAAQTDAELAAEAAALLLRTRGGGSAGHMPDEVQAWVARSARHARAWDAAQRMAIAIAPRQQMARAGRHRQRRRALLASAAMLVLGVGVLMYPSLRGAWRGEVHSSVAQVRVATLDDGSTAVLDADSTLLPARDGRRGARLLEGRAYFDVVADPARPFLVQAGPVEVSVLGTAFAVQARDDGDGDGDEVEIALEHGAVDVRVAERVLRLEPGDRVRVGADGTLQRGRVPVAAIGAWRHGQLVIDDRSIAQMVATLRPHFHGAIVLRGEALAGQRVTGVFDLDEPQQALAAAVAPFGGQVRMLSPWVMVVSAPQ